MLDSLYPIIITATESHGVDRIAIPHRMGIPFPKGALSNADELSLFDQNKLVMPFQHKVLSHWPDSSVRWLLIDFKLTVNKNSEAFYQLLPGNTTTSISQSI